MRFAIVAMVSALVSVSAISAASAQQAVPPRWNWQGSAVCPDGFDYYASENLCIARGYGPRGYGGGYGGGYDRRGYGYGYGQGVPPRWNRAGSAVCPQFYDYHARIGLCLPR